MPTTPPSENVASGSLFADDEVPAPAGVAPATPSPALRALAGQLPDALYMGTSSWYFPGWAGEVWDRLYDKQRLSRGGLAAYAAHPLLRAVGLDRGFYQPLSQAQYADYAASVPAGFRFVVKAPAAVTDALVRDKGGQGRTPNPSFLDAGLAEQAFTTPAGDGLGDSLGALVFQVSPLPTRLLTDINRTIDRLHAMLAALARNRPNGPVRAVEVRNPEWLTPRFLAALQDTGATYCLSLHPRMPPIADQLPILRRLWPGPLVCRWNLNPRHGAYGYEQTRQDYAPFDRLIDPDPSTRETLARVIGGTVGHGQPAFVTVNNKAEGSAPLSVQALARAVLDIARAS